MLTNAQKWFIIALGITVLYFLTKDEALAGESINILPNTLPPQPQAPGAISYQIVLNGPAFDH